MTFDQFNQERHNQYRQGVEGAEAFRQLALDSVSDAVEEIKEFTRSFAKNSKNQPAIELRDCSWDITLQKGMFRDSLSVETVVHSQANGWIITPEKSLPAERSQYSIFALDTEGRLWIQVRQGLGLEKHDTFIPGDLNLRQQGKILKRHGRERKKRDRLDAARQELFGSSAWKAARTLGSDFQIVDFERWAEDIASGYTTERGKYNINKTYVPRSALSAPSPLQPTWPDIGGSGLKMWLRDPDSRSPDDRKWFVSYTYDMNSDYGYFSGTWTEVLFKIAERGGLLA